MSLFFLRLIFVALFALPTAAIAAETACCRSSETENWYFTIGAAAVFTEDYDLTRTFAGSTSTLSHITFDPGYGLVGAIGYRLNPYFRLEGEASYAVSSDFDATNVTADIKDKAGQRVTSLMANVYFDWPNRYYFTPYIGAGAGGRMIRTPLVVKLSQSGNVVEARVPEALVFGYQFMAGLAYEFHDGVFNHKSELVFEYRYVGSETGEDESKYLAGYTNSFEHQAHLLMLGWRIYF